MTASLLPRERRELAPGAVHLPDWLTLDEQRELVASCRAWARPPAPMRATRLPNGGVMSVRTVCLGWHWEPYRYTRWATAPAEEGGARERVKPFPPELVALARRAVADAYGDAGAAAAYEPDCALVNHYDATAKMGLHLDKEEVSPAPVVSLSLGDACRFRFGNTETRGKPYVDAELRSGDVVVFGGPSRFAYHGVPRIFPGTGDPAIGLSEGRLNLTIRETGLTDEVVDAEEAARAARVAGRSGRSARRTTGEQA
ncbi:alpha-ketoglutarate-dependent dioxygenase AlkB [Aquihabitans sp. G128]|uniref:alpha-ketoglutarate-dependent dioxygenase AlkB family protein n=1 Tax=Aquihabitans sp. G128 TaxID=2849779 RepID=UPI001C21B5FC|nr:alpha-ketoglutarate-dependent dioxygenase AlkB [Aquihabitans sp. G128]QXC60737.1 alpha-ketoglutarate-dependent dioxygenase AlkB [Aquihabitans sp. G128]